MTTTPAAGHEGSDVLRAGVLSLLRSSASVASRDDQWLEAFLADAERAVNALQAAQADAMLALEQRAREADASLPVSATQLAGRREEGVVDQIAVTLRCSKVAASHRYEAARAAQGREGLLTSWREGFIDQRKVSVICDALPTPVACDVPGPLREASDGLATEAAAYAALHTAPQTRSWLARRVMAIDPTAAESRHQRASARRHVRLQPLADGMAELSAFLPAVQARRAFDTLTAAAHALEGPDERRTLEQRRADVLVDLVAGRVTASPVQVSIAMQATTLLGADDQPAELAGYGPIPAGVTRKLLAATEPFFRRLITGPGGTLTAIDPQRYRPTPGLEALIRARDLTCRFPGCRRPATTNRSGVDLDHTEPWPAGTTTPDNLAALCRHHHRVKHSRGWAVEQRADGVLHWTTPGGHPYITEPWRYTDPPPK
jgi:hypothetical protein